MKQEDEKYRYVQFPLCLLKETYSDPGQGLNLIIDFGIMNFASKIKYDISEVARQTIYCFYREQDMLPRELVNEINENIELDEDYNGFSGTNFNPETELPQVLELFENQSHLKDLAVTHYQLRQAASSDILNIKIGSYDYTQKRYNKGLQLLTSFESKYGVDCWSSCKIPMLFEFRDSQKDLDLLRAYLGIKSVIGQRDFNISHKSVILSRMFGCKNSESLKEFLKNKEIKKQYDKYSKRYWFEWMLNELENRGFITKIGYKNWGIFISTKYQDKNSLVDAVIANHQKKNLKSQEQQAREKLNSIYKRQHKSNIKTT